MEPQRLHAMNQSGAGGFRNTVAGKRVVVLGMGRSGIAAARLLLAKGASVTVADDRRLDAQQFVHTWFADVNVDRLAINTGSPGCQMLDDVHLLVVSPGIPEHHKVIAAAQTQGIPVVGEVELASWFLTAPIIAVTGTNGKSTTVRLIGEMLKADGRRVFVGGNLGTPLSEAALAPVHSQNGSAYPFEMVVAEVSSFQLETIATFHPVVAVLLNITPDHLDRHPSFEAYQAAKRKIFTNQMPSDAAIVNMDDPCVSAMTASIRAQRLGFSVTHTLARGVFVDRGTIVARLKDNTFPIMNVDDIPLRGRHNYSNVLAAVAAALWCQCSVEAIRRAVQGFTAAEHALEPVRVVRGVHYVNDSKGTNVDATLRALESFEEPLVVILGGKEKGGDFRLLREAVRQRVKGLVVLGEAAAQIVEALGSVAPIKQAASLSEAVELAAGLAERGDVVLFSPGCASFDMFRNYEDRGRQFKHIVQALVDE